ncbi:phage recombination protein Bet [Pseudomonas bohemica]|uniref:phage recombination protein Bet n=1 Tax=Pseudomonas bohemica TaxID=2044872 RepID=UPI001F158319|nr:phage recombination protein Bet [Pseudomonas bohemica]
MSAVMQRQESVPSLALDEQELIDVLRSSLYPGAADASIKMVIGYCQATGLDPMQKPVHIVPMKVSTGQKDQYGNDIKANRDVVMPGIGLYRINASRTGQYAGVSEPEYGPTRALEFQKEVWVDGPTGKRQKTFIQTSIEYPEWCRVTVDKLVDGQICHFTATEYWLENYAEKGDSGAPNTMWAKRPRGQIAKCAEAQALRKAFPEVGSAPTAEEMEGKAMETVRDISPQPAAKQEPEAKKAFDQDKFEEKIPAWQAGVDEGKATPGSLISFLQTKYTLTDAQIDRINRMAPIEGEAE